MSSYLSNTERYRPNITPTAGRLRGKVALITGGARGIGRAIAERFAREGASVSIADLDGEAAEQTARSIGESGVRAIGVSCDVTSRTEAASAIDKTTEQLGAIDILVNNAGMIVFGSLLECRLGDWNRMMDVDLTGAFHFTQLVGEAMIARKQGGRMIHIGSTASLLPTAKQAAYCVAKAGLAMISRLAALELASYGITSNLLCPQGAVTDINRDLLSDPQVMHALEDKIPMRRLATVEEIAAAAAFLASDEAAYITGAELVHDGGVLISSLWWR